MSPSPYFWHKVATLPANQVSPSSVHMGFADLLSSADKTCKVMVGAVDLESQAGVRIACLKRKHFCIGDFHWKWKMLFQG